MNAIVQHVAQADHETRTLREKWFAVVAGLVYPQNPAHAADALCKYLTMLADLPDGAFTRRSAEHVASQPRRMAIPSYDELGKALRVWWRDNRPQQARIGHDKPEGWDERDDVWHAYWHRQRSAGFPPHPTMPRPPGGMPWRDHAASLVRTYSPRAWSQIVAEGANR